MSTGFRIGKGGQNVDKEGRYISHIPKWPGWETNLLCDNCGRTRMDARIYRVRVSRTQWGWLDGRKEPSPRTLKRAAATDKTAVSMDVLLCEVCLAYLKERGPQNAGTKIY